MPEAERDLGNITSGLGDVLIEAGQLGGFSLNFEVANEEAEKILSEAGVVAESRMKDALPNLPGFTEEKLGTTTE